MPAFPTINVGPVVREFAVRVDTDVEDLVEHCSIRGVNPGYPLVRDYPELGEALLIAVTERRHRGEIDLACDLIADRLGRQRRSTVHLVTAA